VELAVTSLLSYFSPIRTADAIVGLFRFWGGQPREAVSTVISVSGENNKPNMYARGVAVGWGCQPCSGCINFHFSIVLLFYDLLLANLHFRSNRAFIY
jgi:hypothetical protein